MRFKFIVHALLLTLLSIPLASALAQTTQAPVTSATTVEESVIKCGVNSFGVMNECGTNVYQKTYVQCYDGYEPVLGVESSCKSFDLWNQYAQEACTNHCSNGTAPTVIPAPVSQTVPTSEPTPALTTPEAVVESGGGGAGEWSAPAVPSTVPSVTNVTTLSSAQCGVTSFKVYNECGSGVYKNTAAQCSDGFEVFLGEASSCKPAELWDQYTREACARRCTGNTVSPVTGQSSSQAPTSSTSTTYGGQTSTAPVPQPVSVCYMSGDLMQEYDRLIVELQSSASDKVRTEEIVQQIIVLKQQMAEQQNDCIQTPIPSVTTTVAVPIVTPTEAPATTPIVLDNVPVTVPNDHCNEAAQWEAKMVYYQKLGSLTDDELQRSGFSRVEIEQILKELSSGIVQVRAQCDGQTSTTTTPTTAITGSASLLETVKPVVMETGTEIESYYKAKLEETMTVKNEEQQIQALISLRNEINGFISDLIKSRSELEVSELETLVKEVTISQGEIQADDIIVQTTEKKLLLNVGDRPVSIEPTTSQVLIRDQGLEVNTIGVTIEDNVLSVGGAPVNISASEVTEQLNLTPTVIELTEENDQAVYSININERRKLFGLFPFNNQRTVTVDAGNGQTISNDLPWYRFLTTI